MIDQETKIVNFIREMLTENKLIINDGISVSNPIIQRSDVLEGDPMSPTLFNIATADVHKNHTGVGCHPTHVCG